MIVKMDELTLGQQMDYICEVIRGLNDMWCVCHKMLCQYGVKSYVTFDMIKIQHKKYVALYNNCPTVHVNNLNQLLKNIDDNYNKIEKKTFLKEADYKVFINYVNLFNVMHNSRMQMISNIVRPKL